MDENCNSCPHPQCPTKPALPMISPKQALRSLEKICGDMAKQLENGAREFEGGVFVELVDRWHDVYESVGEISGTL